MRNIKLTLQYDGTAYHGWQIQKNACTVQETVQTALAAITGAPVSVIGCGRTDTGVHAKEYICNFKSESAIPAARFPYALNTKLPGDIVCTAAQDAAPDFHAKASATRKHYAYQILNSPFPDAFLRDRAWHYKEPLDIEAMKEAAAYFVGTHDFIGFASAGFTVKTTVRTIYSLEVARQGSLIRLDVVGNGFLYNMVRIITGTLVFVGRGKIKSSDIPDILASKQRERAGITAPPEGLYLWGVEY